MRLTNVAQMDLGSGRLFSYGVRIAPERGRRLPVSYDQGRHVGDRQRPGSWMAFAFRLETPATHDELAAAWDAVVARHGTLHSVFSRRDGGEREAPNPSDHMGVAAGLQLHDVAIQPGTWREHPVASGQATREVLREVLDEACAPFSQPSHCLCVVEPDPADDDQRQEIVIAADHAHLDMWSLVIIVRDLLACVDDLRAGRPLGAELPVAPPSPP